MINRLMRKFGFISVKDLIEVAIDTYYKNCCEEQVEEKEFYYRCGNANAIGYMCGKLGVDITMELKVRNLKRVYGNG